MFSRFSIAVFLGAILGVILFLWLRAPLAPPKRPLTTTPRTAGSQTRPPTGPTPPIETQPLGNEPVGLALDPAGGNVYWAEYAAGRIRRADLDGSGVEVIAEDIPGPFGVAVDPEENYLYWTTDGPYPRLVQRARLDGSEVRNLSGGPAVNRPSAITLGPDGHVYWSESVAGRIRTLAPRGIIDVVDSGVSSTGDRPGSEVTWAQGIAVDEAANQLYWTELISGMIQRVHLKSGIEEIIVRTSGECDTPAGIALDAAAKKLYWADSGCGAILRADFDGSGLTAVIPPEAGLIEPRGLALDVAGGKLYWTDSATEKIQRANLDGSAIEDLVLTGPPADAQAPEDSGCGGAISTLRQEYARRKVHDLSICLDKVGAVKAVKRDQADAAKVAVACVTRLRHLAPGGSVDAQLSAAVTSACPDGPPDGHPILSACTVPAAGAATAHWLRCLRASYSQLAWYTVNARLPRGLEWVEEVRPFIRTLPSTAAASEDVKATVEALDRFYAAIRDLSRGVRMPPPGGLPASGQRTSYPSMDQPVADDGALLAGARMRFRDNLDGTITDINTNLTWEKKCDCPGNPHDFRLRLPWTADGHEDTIWDWLDKMNREGTRGFAGFSDWRIPNAKELISIINYERFNPAVGVTFDGSLCGLGCDNMRDPMCSCTSMKAYWSSTTFADNDRNAMAVGFHLGLLGDMPKTEDNAVRAVRGGEVASEPAR